MMASHIILSWVKVMGNLLCLWVVSLSTGPSWVWRAITLPQGATALLAFFAWVYFYIRTDYLFEPIDRIRSL